jgi:CMP-N-acetylneuraminic acid synthetase
VYLAIIPARAGSKRIPGKNLVALRGTPLIDYTLRAARAASRLGAVVVSTDSEAIAGQARARGALVPALRPAALAGDDSPVVQAMQHALSSFEAASGAAVTAVVLLQPTSPFRDSSDIDRAIDLFERNGADSLTAVCPARQHPYYAWKSREASIEPLYSYREMQMERSLLPSIYLENGAIYVTRRDNLLRGRLYGEHVIPFVMEELRSLDIDTPLDLAWAEFLLERGLVRLPEDQWPGK